VRYRMEDYANRNRDFLSADLINVMRRSSDSRLVNIFLNKMTKTGHVTSDPTPAERSRRKSSLIVPEANNKVSTKQRWMRIYEFLSIKFNVYLSP